MESRYMRLRAAIVLAALVCVPLAAMLGTWRPWSRPRALLTNTPEQSARSDTTSQPDQIAAPYVRPSDVARGGSGQHSAPRRGTRKTAPESAHTPSTETAPTASIRDVVAETAQDSAPGTEPTESHTEQGRGIERFWQAAQERLEALGAVNWRLESWGSQGLYRFSCAVSLAGQSRSTRYFEAVASRPETAIEQVVSEVEAFRAGQPASAAGPQPLRR